MSFTRRGDDDDANRSGSGRESANGVRDDMREIARKLRKMRKPKHQAGEDSPEPSSMPPVDLPPPKKPLIVGDLRRKARRMEPPASDPEPEPRPRRISGPPVLLEETVAGESVESDDGTRAYIISERITDREPAWAELCRKFGNMVAEGRLPIERPEQAISIDLETTGLTSTPLFLIGAMVWEDGGFVVKQYFARHYGEERAVISLFLEECAGKDLLITFNGKSYDWPYVKMRAAATRVPFAVEMEHIDLLHESRRAWRHMLPNCKLQTIENHICGRGEREGDIPGSEIPEAYHEYVRTGNAADMISVLEHNYLDLVTLADILVRLPIDER